MLNSTFKVVQGGGEKGNLYTLCRFSYQSRNLEVFLSLKVGHLFLAGEGS